MTRRVRRPKDKSRLFNTLTDKDNHGVFETYKDLMLFASALGAYKNKFKPFEGTDEQIDYGVFTRYTDNEALIHIEGIYKDESIEILSAENSDKRLTIMEEYANGGLELIEEKTKSMPIPLDAILELILEVENETSNDERDFSNIFNYFKNE